MNSYYDHLLAFLGSSVKEGFMSEGLMPLISVDTKAEPLLESLVQAAGSTRNNQRLNEI